MKSNFYLLFITLLIFQSPKIYGQLVEYAIPNPTPARNDQSSRITSTPLSLPFWDDFYTADGIPDDSLWDNSNNVLINNHYAYLPPTLNTATFDGLQASGAPYNTDPESSERTDRLTSHAIDLSGLSASSNVVLSFFYQFGGYGEAPDLDDMDKLVVEFKNIEGVWVPVEEILVDPERSSKDFYQLLIRIEDPSYFHDDFQFAFQTFGNQSGPYDVWNLDYVYLNSNRSLNDIYYPDRAINNDLSSIFGSYTAIPRQHISLENDINTPYYLLNNLYNNFQTYRQSVEISLINTDGSKKTTAYPLTDQGTNTPIFRDEIDTIRVPFPISDEPLPDPDSLVSEIHYKIAVKTFDNRLDSGNYSPKYSPIDFRVNDTLSRSFKLDDYYAYDDGLAEGAAGLQIAGNKLAYKFHLMHVDSAYVHGVDINTVYAGTSANGKSIELQVYENGGGKPGKLLRKEVITIGGDDARDAFTRYSLRQPIVVKDTFYIGFTLTSSGKLPIGLDKNNDNADKLMENVNGEWLPIGDRVIGTLMMRPFFGPEPDDPITAIEPAEGNHVVIYPNPSQDGVFYIKGNVSRLQVIDVSGRAVQHHFSSDTAGARLMIRQKGIFILKMEVEDRIVYHKVIVN